MCAQACSSKASSMCSAPSGLAARIEREGLVHHGIELRFEGRGHRIALSELTGGRTITIYGQNRVVEDLIAARACDGGDAPLRGLRRRAPRPRDGAADDSVPARGPRARRSNAMSSPAATASTASAGASIPARCPDRVRARLSLRLARDPRRGGAVDRRADLRLPRPRLRPAQPAVPDDQPPLPPGAARRGRRRRGPTTGSGPSCTCGSHATTAGRCRRAR